MSKTLEILARHYRSHSGHSNRRGLEALDEIYRVRRNAVVAGLAIASSTVALNSYLNDLSGETTIDPDQVDPQVREAFELKFPRQELAQQTPHELQDQLNGWSGTLFEVKVRDRLNDGEWVGDLRLEEGQIATLAASPVQQGWDLVILPESKMYQLKATESLQYVRDTVEELQAEWSNVDLIVTDDVHIPGVTINSGISDNDLDLALDNAIDAFDGSELAETVGDVVPYVGAVALLAAFGLQSRRIKAKRDHGVSWSRIAKEESGSAVGKVAGLLSPVPLTARLTTFVADTAIWQREARGAVAATIRRTSRMIETMQQRNYVVLPLERLACCEATTRSQPVIPPPTWPTVGSIDSRHAAQRLTQWLALRRLSFILWAVAFVLLVPSAALGFFAWLIAFGLWIAAQSQVIIVRYKQPR